MSSGYSYEVFIDSSGVGHAFIGIYGPNGESQVWGYYPEGSQSGEILATFSGGYYALDHGILVRDDQWGRQGNELHKRDWSTGRIEITQEQYDLMNTYIYAIENTPGDYFLLGNNCTQFVENMLVVTGMRSPLEDAIAPRQLKWQLIFGEWLNKSISNLFENVRSFFTTAESIVPPPPRRDPLILDLDRDGVETTNVKDGAYFDHDGNGFAEQTGWASSDDGLLVLDRNGDGIINDGRELFGDQTILANGQKAANGFQALAELDSNADSAIDSNDAAYTQLRVWQDIDGDGYSNTDELHTLSELGIASISTASSIANTTDPQGNTQTRIGTYTKADGSTSTIANVSLQRDTTYTIAEEWLDVPTDIAALPDLQGYGNVYDLHQAIVRDTSGQQGYMKQESTYI